MLTSGDTGQEDTVLVLQGLPGLEGVDNLNLVCEALLGPSGQAGISEQTSLDRDI